MTPPARWGRGSKAVVVTVGTIALVSGVILAWTQFTIARRWTAMEHRISELAAESRSRDGRRPPVLLPQRPGNSWEGYAAALQYSAPLLERNFLKLGSRREGAAVEKFLDDLAPAFERLLAAAHAEESRGAYDWTRLDPAGFPQDSPYRYDNVFVSSAMLEVRRLADSGRTAQAVDLLLAIGQLGHDLGENGVGFTLIGAEGALHEVNEECRRLLSEGRLGRDPLRELDRGLQALDRAFTGDSMKNGILAYGQKFLRGETLEWGGPGSDKEIRPGWRYLYSPSALEADAFFRALHWAEELADAGRSSLEEEAKVRMRMQSEAKASENRLAVTLAGSLDQWSAQRAWLADLRIVRIGAHFLGTGEILSLDDPFGKSLLTEHANQELRIWSAGKDNPDQGGTYPKIEPLTVKLR